MQVDSEPTALRAATSSAFSLPSPVSAICIRTATQVSARSSKGINSSSRSLAAAAATAAAQAAAAPRAAVAASGRPQAMARPAAGQALQCVAVLLPTKPRSQPFHVCPLCCCLDCRSSPGLSTVSADHLPCMRCSEHPMCCFWPSCDCQLCCNSLQGQRRAACAVH